MSGNSPGDSLGGGARSHLAPLTGRSGVALCVVLAEDVPTNQLIARNMLRGFGCRVELAADGAQALSAVMRGGCDLVLMDVAMPGMDGLEATRRIRAIGGDVSHLPVIGLTAFGRSEELQRCFDAGMDQVLTKPLTREALYAALRSALDAPAPAVAVRSGNAEVLDERLLADLTEGLEALQVQEVLQRVVEDIGTHTTAALVSVESGDLDGLARACHVLKGLAGSFGIGELSRLARAIERDCREGDREGAMARALSDLESAAAAACSALRAYRRAAEGGAA